MAPRRLRERRSAVGASASPASAPRAPKRRWCVCGGPLRELPAHAEACWVGRCGTCRWSVGPEGLLDPCAAPKRRAGPAPSRGTEVLRASWGRRSGSGKARSWLPRSAEPRKASRRSAPSSLSLGGPKPGRGGLTVRKRTRGTSSSLDRGANRAGVERMSFPVPGTRQGDGSGSGKAGIRLERVWSRQRTFRRMARRLLF